MTATATTLKTKKRAGNKKEKAITQVKGVDHTHKPKNTRPRQKPSIKPNSISDKSNDTASGGNEIESTASDFCTDNIDQLSPAERAPVEVWTQIFSYVGASHVAPLSMVSKTMLDVCRFWPRWRTICEKNELGRPKRKYKTYMAIVCSESYYICDLCDSRSTGLGRRFRESEIPLLFAREDDGHRVWRLCRDCRYWLLFIKFGDKTLKGVKHDGHVRETWVKEHLALKMPIDFSGIPNQWRFLRMLFPKRKVVLRAMKIHGGWIGIEAAKNKVSTDVNKIYRARKNWCAK